MFAKPIAMLRIEMAGISALAVSQWVNQDSQDHDDDGTMSTFK